MNPQNVFQEGLGELVTLIPHPKPWKMLRKSSARSQGMAELCCTLPRMPNCALTDSDV